MTIVNASAAAISPHKTYFAGVNYSNESAGQNPYIDLTEYPISNIIWWSSFGATFFIKDDGTLWGFGTNTSNRLGIPSVSETVVPLQIAPSITKKWIYVVACSSYAFAITEDFELYSWGTSTSGCLGLGVGVTVVTVPTKIPGDWKMVIGNGGNAQVLGIKTDGTSWGWGLNSNSQASFTTATANLFSPTPTGIVEAVDKVIPAATSSLVLIGTTVKTWGFNAQGQLGDGTTVAKTTSAVTVSGQFKDIGSRSSAIFGIKTDGTLWSWGSYVAGLGFSSASNVLVPTNTNSGSNWSKIYSYGSYSPLALKTNGTYWTWGERSRKLGNSAPFDSVIPTQFNAFTGVEVISPPNGTGDLIGVKKDNKVFVCGYQQNGANGVTVTTHRNYSYQAIPVDLTNATAASVINPTFVKNGQVISWGRNDNLHIRNELAFALEPLSTSFGLGTIVSAASNTSLMAVVNSAGEVWVRGWNYYGILGNGTSSNVYVTQFTKVTQITNAVSVSVGWLDTIAVVTSAGGVWLWGRNHAGQVGNGSIGPDVTTPFSPYSAGVAEVSCSGNHTILRMTDGTIRGTGGNSNGQFGTGPGTNVSTFTYINTGSSGITKIYTTTDNTFFLRGTALWGTGGNTTGQLGNNSTTTSTSFVQIAGTWKSFSVSQNRTCAAINSIDELWVWGAGTDGQLGDDGTANRLTPYRPFGTTKFQRVFCINGATYFVLL